MLLFHECLQFMKLWKYLFIIPWDIVSTLYIFEWLNATNASIALHAGDSVITFYLIMNALEQQAVPSMFRWMHVAQRGCWITAALQVEWELMGTEVGRHFWDVQGKLQQIAHLHSPPRVETPQLHWATCSNVKSSSHWKKFFLHSDGVFCVSVCAETVNRHIRSECTRHRQGEDRQYFKKNIQICTQKVGV